jgi:hypothetical protein
MDERDVEPFAAMLQDVWDLYPHAKVPTPGQVAMFFRALGEHPIHAVRKGFDRHVRDPQRGRFPPLPADVIAQIVGEAANDRRPGPEEAWAIAIHSADEARTVVWTEEIAQAWGIAKGIAANGDDVGARMAFKEAYTRLVAEARAALRPATWSASLGHDPEQRDKAIERAQVAGLLPAPSKVQEQPQLEAPAGTAAPMRQHMPFHIVQELEAVRARLLAKETAPVEDAAPLGHFRPVPDAALPPDMRGGAA